MVVLAVSAGQEVVGTVILLCQSALLRIGEPLRMEYRDLVVLPDSIVVILGVTKTGIEQKVVLEDEFVRSWLVAYLQARPGKMSERLFPVSYHRMAYWIDKLTKVLDIDDLRLTSHSFRRGGASDFASMDAGRPFRAPESI